MVLSNRNKKGADRKNSGFTLVELIVVIAIIAILAAIAIPSVGGYLASAKRANALSDALQLATSLNIHNTISSEKLDGESLPDIGVPELSAMLTNEGLMPQISGDIEIVAAFLVYRDGLFEPDDERIDSNLGLY